MGLSPDFEHRRQEVSRLLKDVAQHKLLVHGTGEAMKKAEAAYRLAYDPPALPEPWTSLTAYRLAHLILRTVQTREELERADLYFCQAASSEHLGPMPQIYRLAVLHRLHAHHPEETFRAMIRELFLEAAAAIKRFEAKGAGGGEDWQRAQIQSGAFNMLELAAYFLGAPYSLEGLGGPFSDSLFRGMFPESPDLHWALVGRERALIAVRYSKELALQELDAIGERIPGAILFKVSPEDDSSLRLATGPWTRTSPNGLRLLAVLLMRNVSSRIELVRKVMGVSDADSAYRQVKHRMKKDLASLTGLPAHDIFLTDGKTGLPVINDRITIYGAVEWRGFRR